MTAPQEFADAALSASTADGCVVIVAEHSEANLRWAANSLTTNGQMRSREITVIATFDRAGGHSAGVVTRSVATVEEIDTLVRESEVIGRDAEPADDASPLVEAYANDDAWDAEPATTSADVFGRLAPELGSAFEQWRADDRLLFGFAEHAVTSTFLATSTGLRRRFDQPDGRLELTGKTPDLRRSAWAGVHARDLRDVDAPAMIAALGQRLDWSKTSVELPPGRYETILPPTAVADLMIYAYWTASARDADEGRSVFAAGEGGTPTAGGVADKGGTRIGERLAALPITLRSDPAAPGLQCPPFEIATQSSGGVQSVFDNGLPVTATDWIDDGTLRELIRTRAWARQTGTAPRPAIGNLIMSGGPTATASLDEMIAKTERGLLLTSLWYIREVDPQTLLLTGLTRDGVYLVEDGQVRGAVNNFRFNESPVDLLSRISEVGATEATLPREWSDFFRRAAMPAIRVPDFNMSTVSPAS